MHWSSAVARVRCSLLRVAHCGGTRGADGELSQARYPLFHLQATVDRHLHAYTPRHPVVHLPRRLAPMTSPTPAY
jgi:hypothetical protein